MWIPRTKQTDCSIRHDFEFINNNIFCFLFVVVVLFALSKLVLVSRNIEKAINIDSFAFVRWWNGDHPTSTVTGMTCHSIYTGTCNFLAVYATSPDKVEVSTFLTLHRTEDEHYLCKQIQRPPPSSPRSTKKRELTRGLRTVLITFYFLKLRGRPNWNWNLFVASARKATCTVNEQQKTTKEADDGGAANSYQS